ncbi:MAG: hypothetical protein DWQ35_08975 [Planctomycetota bacterium]|nr:MAG: hypothetical protein DWQ35_08975 [Planctomycetota bacterium]REK26327.1 MAG: hypothetical protein DWQ42_09565 [Planctomycetota bacterium]REK45878.1 MAG: hypothetical protein DWQ46_08280 [Planctomycetota bacterium]
MPRHGERLTQTRTDEADATQGRPAMSYFAAELLKKPHFRAIFGPVFTAHGGHSPPPQPSHARVPIGWVVADGRPV